MASKNQITANRRNAKKSTGPRTKKGKAVAKLNSLKHGLLAEQPLLPGEDGAAFEAIRHELIQQYDPVGVIETQLVERIAGLMWRLRRAGLIEAGIIEYQRLSIGSEQGCYESERLVLPPQELRLELLKQRERAEPYRQRALKLCAEERRIAGQHTGEQHTEGQHNEEQRIVMTRIDEQCRAEDEANAVEDGINAPLPKLGHSFIRDAKSVDGLGKLQRHERSIERSLYAAVHEPERLQRNRRDTEIVTIEGEVAPSERPSNTNVEQLKPLAD